MLEATQYGLQANKERLAAYQAEFNFHELSRPAPGGCKLRVVPLFWGFRSLTLNIVIL